MFNFNQIIRLLCMNLIFFFAGTQFWRATGPFPIYSHTLIDRLIETSTIWFHCLRNITQILRQISHCVLCDNQQVDCKLEISIAWNSAQVNSPVIFRVQILVFDFWTTHVEGVGLSTSCSNFLKMMLQFSQKVAQKVLQNSKSCSKVAFNFLV